MYSNEVEEWFVFRSQDQMTNLKRTLDVLLEWGLFVDKIFVKEWRESIRNLSSNIHFTIYHGAGFHESYIKYKSAMFELGDQNFIGNAMGNFSQVGFKLKNIYCLSCKSNNLFVDRENKQLYCPMCE